MAVSIETVAEFLLAYARSYRQAYVRATAMQILNPFDLNVTERFRWAWQFFVQQAAGGFWRGVLPELSATIPGTSVGVKIGSSSSKNEPSSWGDVLVSFDKETGKAGGLLFIDEMQDLARLPDRGQKVAKSLRAALQMARHVTPVFAGSVQHLLAPFFATSAAAFFKSVRLQHHLKPFEQEACLRTPLTDCTCQADARINWSHWQ